MAAQKENTGNSSTPLNSIVINETIMVDSNSTAPNITVLVLAYTYVSLLFVSVVLNIIFDVIFIVAYAKYKTLRQNKFTFYVLHMTIADICSSLGILLTTVIGNLYPAKERYYCGFTYFLFFVSFDVSYCLAFVTAVDRYLAITHPLQYTARVTKGHMRLAVGLVWSVVTSSLFLLHVVFNSWDGKCFLTNITPKILFIIFDCGGTAMVCVATGYMYVKMAKVLVQHNKKINSNNHSSNQMRQQESKKAFRSAIFTFVLAFVLVSCRIPYLASTLILYDTPTVEMVLVWLYSIVVVAINPILNFIIYSVKFKEIRHLMKLVFTCGRSNGDTSSVQVLTPTLFSDTVKTFNNLSLRTATTVI